MPSLRLNAHAKINLFLKIGNKRKDGYHSLETLFQEVSLHDELHFKTLTTPKIQLKIAGRSIPGNGDNLVVRALKMLQQKLKVQSGMEVRLTKRIPIGAGLGGGSSDAAAALWGGWILWNKKPVSSYRKSSPAILFQCAKNLGADVSFFLRGGQARATGIGERLRFKRTTKKSYMVLAYPRVHVSTRDAYQMLDRKKSASRASGKYFNSFEPVIFNNYPKIRAVASALEAEGCRPVLMSGSGSAVFGITKNRAQAEKVKRQFSKKPWDVFVIHAI